jgi:hypothetical protein
MARKGLWPTPTVGDSESSGSRNLPGSSANAGVSLTDAVKFGNSNTPRLPTPAARDYRFPNTNDNQKGQLPNVIGGALNPTWVEWLMGLPLGWTGCEPLATVSCRQWLHAHGWNSVPGTESSPDPTV